MTEKVKITHEQADAINWILSAQSIDELIVAHARSNGGYVGRAKALKGMSAIKLTKALRVGYEIERKYKTGEWVRYWKNDCVTAIGKITYIDYEKGLVQFDNTTFTKGIHDVTGYATPEEIAKEKERRKWAEIGREVEEFKDSDIGIFRNGAALMDINAIKAAHEYGDLVGFYPAESFISFEEVEPNAETHN